MGTSQHYRERTPYSTRNAVVSCGLLSVELGLSEVSHAALSWSSLAVCTGPRTGD